MISLLHFAVFFLLLLILLSSVLLGMLGVCIIFRWLGSWVPTVLSRRPWVPQNGTSGIEEACCLAVGKAVKPTFCGYKSFRGVKISLRILKCIIFGMFFGFVFVLRG